MRKKRHAATMVVVAGALAWAAPANADPQPGCQAYGELVAGLAQAPGPGGSDIVAPIATSAPGAVAALSESLRAGSCS